MPELSNQGQVSVLPPDERGVSWSRAVSRISPFLSVDGLRRHLQTPLYANAYYLMTNTVINSLSGFVFWTVAARFYTADDVGIASAVISAMMFLASLSSLGLDTGLIRFLPRAGETADQMLDSSLTFLTIVSLIAAAIFLSGLPIWSPALTFIYGQPSFLIGFVLFVLLATLAGVVNQVFIAYRAARYTLLCSTVTSLLKIPLPILFAAFYGAFGIFASVGIAVAVSLGVALLWFLPAVQSGYFPHPRLCAKVLSGLVPYSIGNQMAVLLAQTPQIILPIMVLNVLGARESAYSYVTWMLASMLFMISGAISTSTFAEGSNEEGSLRDNVRKALGLTVLLSVPASLLILVMGEKLLLLFGREYAEEGARLLTILALSALPVGVNNIYFASKRVTKEIGIIFVLSVLIAGSTLVLSYVLMPHYGIAGTGIGWLVSQGMVTGFIACSALLTRLRRSQS
jgi:O-antigen/teichoic acid export membrane protein